MAPPTTALPAPPPPSPHLRLIDVSALHRLHPAAADGETPVVRQGEHGASIYLDAGDAGTTWHLVDEWTIEVHPPADCPLSTLAGWPCTLYVGMGDRAAEGRVFVRHEAWRRAVRLEIQRAAQEQPKMSWADMSDD